jgi:hypothetical protein
VAVTAVVALAVAVPVTIAWAPAVSSGILLTATVVIAAALVAALAARVSAPGLKETAAIVDRELRSSNCIVTAFECLQASDAVADLVIREATRRLDPVTPAAILPIRLPRHFAALTCAAGAIAIGAVLVQNRQQGHDAAPAQARQPATAAGRDAGARGQRGNTPATQDPASVATSTVAPDAVRRDPNAAGSRTAENNGPSGRDGAPADPATSASPVRSAPSSDAPSPSAQAPAPASASSPAGRAADDSSGRQAAGNTGDRGRQRAGLGADGGSGGGRGSAAGLAARTTSGAGGVNAGSSLAQRAPSPAARPLTAQGSQAAADAAWTRAQAAIARDRIPSDLRQLVQDYFTAIRRAQP